MRVLFTLGTALLLSSGIAFAQQQTPPQPQQQPQPQPQQPQPSLDGQQKESQQTESGRMGKQEPTAQAPSPRPNSNDVFVNGALAVPGAPANTDTVPAKFSEKNAADDALITTAYTFKMLTPEQRRAIYQALKDKAPGNASAPAAADVGIQLPPSAQSQPVPDDLTGKVAELKGYHYIVTDKNVLLVNPASRVVVGAVTQ